MNDGPPDDVRDFWDRVADDWLIQVGDAGDSNRRLNSDPVLWAFAGEVRALDVLDAGCGTGYLSAQLDARGARVTAVDLSERMIAIARSRYPEIDFRVDSCSALQTVEDDSIDLIVSNYVLMDIPDFENAVRSFHRVLRTGGVAVLVFSHPCFPQGSAAVASGEHITYVWDFPYFERCKRVDPPWAHFTRSSSGFTGRSPIIGRRSPAPASRWPISMSPESVPNVIIWPRTCESFTIARLDHTRWHSSCKKA